MFNLKPVGRTMIKVYGALAALLIILMTASQGQDYLDGGYVGSGDYGEIRQYFTDPIFYSPGSSYASSGPATSGIRNYMDRTKDVIALGSMASKRATSKTEASVPDISLANAAGRWHLELSEGKTMDLDLIQSGARIFGRGSITSDPTAQWVVASGSISGSSITLDVVPESGIALYEISLDIKRLNLALSYIIFRAGSVPGSGTVRARRIAVAS
jgi:hypothetical protein